MPRERRSVCVGASAGSGKTTRLVGEYFGHIEQGVGIRSILALTFNDEAAANMRKKIRERTLDIPDEKLFDQLNWAQVQTFHSFCSQVLREFHLQAGVPSDFTVIEDMDLQVLLNDAWEELVALQDEKFRQTMVSVCSTTSGLRLRNTVFFLYERRARAVEALQAMSDRGAFRRKFRLMTEEYLDGLLEYFECDEMSAAVDTLVQLADRYAEEGGDIAANYLHRVRPWLLRCSEGGRNEQLLAYQALLGIKGRRNMGSAKKLKEDKEALSEAYEILRGYLEGAENELYNLKFDLDPRSLDIAVEHLMGLRDIFLRFVSLVDSRKAERRCLDFNDLLIKAQELLDPVVPNNKVLELLRQRYQHILVDEYQDTDVPQDRIVRALLGDDKDKLFVVGDGKQSIYLFRGADVTMFKGMLSYVEVELCGRREELGSNYRSTRELVSFVNMLFSRLMDCEENEWEFRYQKVQPYRSGDEGSVTVVQVPGGGQDDKLGMAAAVADQIERLVQGDGRMVHWNGNDHLDDPRKPEYGDITILLRARTNLRYYESVLAERGIPYAVEKGVGFFQRQEIMDIGNLINFLGNQMDDISLYGVLRSPYFGLSDGTLFRIARSSAHGQLFTKLKRFVDEHPEDAQVGNAVKVLAGLLKRSRTVPVSELLNDALQNTGVLGVYAGMSGGKQMIANVEQLLEMVRQREQEGFFTLYDLKDWLDLSVDDSDKEGQAQLEATGDAVRIMTVHASKGLEFPIVILPETHVPPRMDSDQVAMTGIGLFSEVPSVDRMVTYAPVPMRVAATEMHSKSEAQNLRLFYVAATRAKDHFVMLGTRGRKEGEWEDVGEERNDWFSLTMNALELSSADDGVMEFDGEQTIMLRMETFEGAAQAVSNEGLVPCDIPDELSVWEPYHDVSARGEVKLVLPSSVDSKVERKLKGGAWSETKRLLMSKGMDAASYGTMVHEVLRGRSPRTLLSSRHLKLSPQEENAAIDGLSQMYERFMNTDLMKQRKEGGMDLQELPFELREGDTLYMGVIDRLVEMADGSWALIDYKTVSHGEDTVYLVTAFREQMKIYGRAVRELVGREAASFVYLTESDTLLGLN